MVRCTNGCKEFCLSVLLTCMFIPGLFTNTCTESQRQLNIDPSLVTELRLARCNISNINLEDFIVHDNLQILDLSYNLLKNLDFSVFEFNAVLEYLDISHNNLHTINCSSIQFIKGIKHLDMSYNNFESINICQEFSTLTKLKHLRLSTKKISKDDFLNIAHHELDSVFLGLEDLQQYDSGALKLLKSEKLHIILPNLRSAWTLLPLLTDAFTSFNTLEISRIQCVWCNFYLLKLIAGYAKVSTLILTDVMMSWRDMSQLLEAMWKSSVEHLFISNFIIVNDFNYVPIDVSEGSIKTLQIENVIPRVFEYTKHPLIIISEMLVPNMTLSNVELTYFFCPQSPSIFQFLTLANNGLTDGVFERCESLPALQYLNLHNNRLMDLMSLSSITSSMNSLRHLDVSFNDLHFYQNRRCEWSKTLVVLNLSKNKLTDSVFQCLPDNVEILDLSRNQLQSISKHIEKLTALKELNLALNLLTNVPDCSHMSKSLMVLNIDGNAIFSPSGKYFQSCQHVKRISAQNNKYVCDCGMRAFVSSVKAFQGEMVEWPVSYKCEIPDEHRGVMLEEFYVSEISCNIYLLVAIVVCTILILMFLLAFTCKYFDLPWYIRMTCQWLQRKYRARVVTAEDLHRIKYFHAFVSYSQHDGNWVRNSLIPNLEREDGSVKICLHERDFIPGKAIMDNIIGCIEGSFKSIFVLSPNFVQSEWCHYELYFAQHSLFGKDSDNLILILLEPIPQYLIPDKYSKLKALMKQRTYMEWPKEKAKQVLFWANLRGAIQINLPVNEEEMEHEDQL